MMFDTIETLVDGDFRVARRRALLNRIQRGVRGRPADLLRLEDVRRRIALLGQRDLGVQTVPMDQIVGTESRSADFDRSFLPRRRQTEERWKRIGRAFYRG